MARPARSPLLGYNHNVKYGGHIFHVQTEDSGPGNPHLFTHLFFEGSILASKRGQYDPETPEDEVRAMMQAQHKAILKELKQTAFDERITRFFSLRGEPFPAAEFLPPADETPQPAVNPEAPPPQEVTAAEPEPDVLDLDALPATSTEKSRTPEPLPARYIQPPSVAGPGAYTFRRTAREVIAPAAPPAPAAQAAKPRPLTSPRTPAVRPITPVVVQRQVVVGAGAPATVSTRKGTTTPVRRRPVSGGPYVVKEGSHVNVAAAVTNRRADAQARPLAPGSEASEAPRTAEPRRPPQEASPSSFVTDQSLDDVILAYLSHGEGKR